MGARRTTRGRLAALAVAVLVLAGCGSGGGTSTPTPTPSPTGTSTVVPQGLTAALVSPTDLTGTWVLSEKLKDFPDGKPGVIPADYRYRLPTLDLCPKAGSAAVAAAKGLTRTWQVFTTLERPGTGNFVTVAEMLYADPSGNAATAFGTLRAGMTACFGTGAHPAAWPLPAVGTERIGEQRVATVGAGTWNSHVALVRSGQVVMYLGILDVGRAAPALTGAELTAIVNAAAAKLPR